MTKTFSKICDFIIRIIMLFTTIVSLIFFSEKYPNSSLIFGLLALLLILTIATKGLLDIFAKE